MKKIILILIITIASIGGIIYSGIYYTESISEVTICKANLCDAENTITVSGSVKCPDANCISASEDMLITKMLVSVGDKIKKGTPICEGIVVTDSVSAWIENQNMNQIVSVLEKNVLGISEYDMETFYKNQKVTTICADKSGVISTIAIKENSLLATDDTILTITDEPYNTIVVNIPETQILEIEIGQPVRVSITALPQKTFTGYVTNIENEAKQTAASIGKETTVGVTITLNENCNIKSGFSARCTIITSIDKNTLIIPYECIDSDTSGDYIYTLSDEGTAIKKYIQIKKEYNSGVSISSGVDANDLLIKDTINIINGQKVRIREEEL